MMKRHQRLTSCNFHFAYFSRKLFELKIVLVRIIKFFLEIVIRHLCIIKGIYQVIIFIILVHLYGNVI